jgi:uncharacterized DUF497 family protein
MQIWRRPVVAERYQSYYNCSTLDPMAVDWTHRGEYIVAKHQVTPAQADEALADPDAVTFNPDYNSQTGTSVRTIGYSPSAKTLITVITVHIASVIYGANAWESNSRDRRYYNQGGPDEQEN